MAEERLEEIRQARLAKRQTLIDDGNEPYPAEARRTHTTAEMNEQFDQLMADTAPLILVGRVMAVRHHGAVAFLDLMDTYGSVQVQLTKNEMGDEDYDRLVANVDVGDFVQALGQLVKTEKGVKTLLVKQAHMLSKSIRPLPSTWYGLKDHEKRWRHRELDFLLNDESRKAIIIRSQVIDWLRSKLKKEGFLEVETPILQAIAGGAAARPFITHHNSLDTDLYLRIAPEIYLKRLLVGGLEKVFEIGRSFRNEGIDKEHNPEFTTCEFYWAYADYEDLMDFSETLIAGIAKAVTGGRRVSYQKTDLSFATPWKRVSFVDVMKDKFGVDVLEQKDTELYLKVLKERDLEVPKVQTFGKLIDELYKEVIRPTLIQPTILYDYPVELAPLAKVKAQDRRIAEIMQIVIAGTEIVKAYTELNDPVEQRKRFEKQQSDRAAGDSEVAEVDEEYLHAMEYGMPPAAGWGMGIDRLTAILADTSTVRDTITFPLLKPKDA